jgi:hypothetical protein
MKKCYFLTLLFFVGLFVNAQVFNSIVNITQPATCTQNASITVEATSGVAPYTYTISLGQTISSPQVSKFFTNLVPGVYVVITTDALNNNNSVTVTIDPPQIPFMTISGGGSSDSVFLRATGGVPPYQYSRDNLPYSNNDFFGNLSVGNHTFKVIDSNSCVFSLDYIVLAPALSFYMNGTDVSCFGGNDGTLNIITQGGLAPFTYSIDNRITQSTSNIFTNLRSGSYEASVTDALGYINVLPFTITEPLPLLSTTNIVGSVITVNATGGTPPYEYSIDGGRTFQSANNFANLPIGNYTIYTRDIKGCEYIINSVVNVAPPIVNNNQTSTTINFPSIGSTLADIAIQGSNVKWYANSGINKLSSGKNILKDTPLPLSTVVQNNTTYYASQTINGFESQQRLAVFVTIGTVLSTNENVFQNFKFSSNPIKNSFVVSNNTFKINEIDVFDLSGKKVISKTINELNSETDFSSLTSGIYFVKIKTEQFEKTLKVLKE